jgi:predicted nucleotidyltransferase
MTWEIVPAMTAVRLQSDLIVQSEALAALCRRHHITWLAVYGSALRDDFGPASDVDLLVEFVPGQTPSLFGMMDIEQELSALLAGRVVDLGTKRSLNRWIKDRVLDEARVLYDAA